MSEITEPQQSSETVPASTAIPELPDPPAPAETPVLQRLPAPPFPRSGFPLMGILASVYEHVIEVTSGRRSRENA